APVKDNLRNIARRLGRDIEDLTVIVLDRPRHKKIIADVRAAGARIRLISDGDLSAGISAAVAGTNIHACIGIGGAPEGVLTAAAIKCLYGEIQARLAFDPGKLGVDSKKVPSAEQVVERLKSIGSSYPYKTYYTDVPARALRVGLSLAVAAVSPEDRAFPAAPFRVEEKTSDHLPTALRPRQATCRGLADAYLAGIEAYDNESPFIHAVPLLNAHALR